MSDIKIGANSPAKPASKKRQVPSQEGAAGEPCPDTIQKRIKLLGVIHPPILAKQSDSDIPRRGDVELTAEQLGGNQIGTKSEHLETDWNKYAFVRLSLRSPLFNKIHLWIKSLQHVGVIHKRGSPEQHWHYVILISVDAARKYIQRLFKSEGVINPGVGSHKISPVTSSCVMDYMAHESPDFEWIGLMPFPGRKSPGEHHRAYLARGKSVVKTARTSRTASNFSERVHDEAWAIIKRSKEYLHPHAITTLVVKMAKKNLVFLPPSISTKVMSNIVVSLCVKHLPAEMLTNIYDEDNDVKIISRAYDNVVSQWEQNNQHAKKVIQEEGV